MHGVHRPKESCSLISFIGELGNLTKERMPCLQRGHGIEPVGATMLDGIWLVEHR